MDHSDDYCVSVRGVSPVPLLDSIILQEYENTTTYLGLTEQLYTARGSQG